MVAPESLLKATSLRTLEIGVNKAFMDTLNADWAVVVADPSFLLNLIDAAVLRAIEHFPRPPPRGCGQPSVVAAVRLVIISEMVYGRFQGAGNNKRLHHAINAAVHELRLKIEDLWLYRIDVAYLPPKILANIFAYLGLGDFARASRTCRRWRDAALGPLNNGLRAFARHVPTADDYLELHAIDALAGEETLATLYARLIPEALLHEPALRLVRPSPAMFARAVAALPHADRLWVRVYDSAATCFAVGTASGAVRECVGVEWDLWTYVLRDQTLWFRVRDVEVPNPSWAMKELVGDRLPHAMTPATRRKHGRGNLDSAGEAVHLPEPRDPIRLLWPYGGERSTSAPAASVPDDDDYVDDGFLDFLDPGSDSDSDA